jgi:hypothetical protein
MILKKFNYFINVYNVFLKKYKNKYRVIVIKFFFLIKIFLKL